MNDLKPQPKWRSVLAATRAAWKRGRIQRQKARQAFKTAALKLLTLAVSVLGAILISYGVWTTYAPAGYVVGGVLCWYLQWSHEQDKRRRG